MFRLLVLSTFVALTFGASFQSQKLRFDEKIVRGEIVDIKDYPYQVSLLNEGEHYCGGSIISETHVVTTAECTFFGEANFVQVRAGSSTKDSGGVVVQVAEIHQHPLYNSRDSDYDIAVLKLAEPLEFNKNIQPISLNFQQPGVGTDGVETGWGLSSITGDFQSQLKAVTVSIISQDDCKKAYPFSSVTDVMICAVYPEGGKDACLGDSGGPLVVGGKLAGVFSWGIGCVRPEHPGVYANVPNLADFILEVTGPL